MLFDIIAPIDRVFILGGQTASYDPAYYNLTRSSPSSSAVHAVEGRPCRLRCVALGGYPPPSVDLYVGRRDVTRYLAFTNGASLAPAGQAGMRTIYFRSERTTDSFVASADDDGSPVRCVVVVPGSNPAIETVRLDVDC